MGYDDVVPLLGNFGRYQKRVYLLLCLPAILCGFHKMSNVFLLAEPDYRCQLPNESPTNTTYKLSNETQSKWFPLDAKNQKYSSCSVIIDNKTEPCTNFIFDDKYYGHTAVVDWQLTCTKSYMKATGDSIFMVGVMIGSIVFGDLSDRYGRKIVFIISLVLQVVFGMLAAVAPEFWSFTLCRAVVAATTSGVFLVAYVIALEMVGPGERPLAGTILHVFFSGGYMLIALFAFYITYWRYLQFALTVPGIFFLCYWWFIPESVRWLITKGRLVEAKTLIQTAAKENKVTISNGTLDDLLMSEIKPVNRDEKKASILDVFKHSNLRKRSLIIFFDWFANNLTYYGLSWNTTKLAGNPYLNFVISGAVEVPAYLFLIFTLNRCGRKVIMCGSMITTGVALLLTMTVPHTHDWLIVTLAMIAKFAITASYGTVYIFSTEQFPTVIRNAGLGAGSTCARFGSIIAPYINVLNTVWPPLPLIVYGSVAFVGGVLSLILPETLNKKLPETIEEGESFGKKVKQIYNKTEDDDLVLQVINADVAKDNSNSNNGVESKLLLNGQS